MIVVSLISFKLHLITQIVTEVERLFPSKSTSKSLEVMLIIVPVKEALELHKIFCSGGCEVSRRAYGLPRQRRGPEGPRYHQVKDPGVKQNR
jgi:hypothetical protein